MQRILLPPIMPGDFDLAALNARLRAREVTLDWSNVRGVAADLAPLLAGLDLAADADVYGALTVPEPLLAFIQATIDGESFTMPVGDINTAPPPSPVVEDDGEPLPLPAFLTPPSQYAIREELQTMVVSDLLLTPPGDAIRVSISLPWRKLRAKPPPLAACADAWIMHHPPRW